MKRLLCHSINDKPNVPSDPPRQSRHCGRRPSRQRRRPSRRRITTTAAAIAIYYCGCALFLLFVVAGVGAATALPPPPPDYTQQQQRDLEYNNDDDDEEDDPYRMVRVVVTIQNPTTNYIPNNSTPWKWNGDNDNNGEVVKATTNSSTSSKSSSASGNSSSESTTTTNNNNNNNKPWSATTTVSFSTASSSSSSTTSGFLRSGIAIATTTLPSSHSTSSTSSSQQEQSPPSTPSPSASLSQPEQDTEDTPFIPEPWIQQQYQDVQFVSRIQRGSNDPTTTTILTLDVPYHRISTLQGDPHITSVRTDTIVYPDLPIVMPSDEQQQRRQRLLRPGQQQQQQRHEQTVAANGGAEPEEIGWGITAVMGSSSSSSTTKLPDAPPSSSSSSTTNDCFTICIVDSGILMNHPDLPKFTSTTATANGNSHIWGRSFNLPYHQTWDVPIYNHGTHIMGIMTAVTDNQIGIQGVLGNAYTQNMCYIVARVFDDHGNGQYDSYILNAVEWCADQNVRIINLSLGSPTSNTEYAKQVYDQIVLNNTLVVSSSGNTYDTTYNYPASFDSVISVGAIDAAFEKASFSSFNNQVNLVAPGVAIQSTVPMANIIVNNNNNDNNNPQRYTMNIYQYSPRINVPLTATMMNCNYAESVESDCPTVAGQFCIAQNGIVSSYEKALTCQRLGGIGLLIYDDVEAYAPITGTLNITLEWVNIPVVGLTKRDGDALVALLSSSPSTSITMSMVDPGYQEISGTSMAVPYVSGIAAKIWSLRPQCQVEQIRQALYSSAKKLYSGISPEYDTMYFGNGLVQAEGAYQALLQMPWPCGDGISTTMSNATIATTTTMTPSPPTAGSTVPPPVPTFSSWNATSSEEGNTNNTSNGPEYTGTKNNWW